MTDDEKEGRDSDGDDDMPELPDDIDSFQDENMDEAISGGNKEEEQPSAKDEL